MSGFLYHSTGANRYSCSFAYRSPESNIDTPRSCHLTPQLKLPSPQSHDGCTSDVMARPCATRGHTGFRGLTRGSTMRSLSCTHPVSRISRSLIKWQDDGVQYHDGRMADGLAGSSVARRHHTGPRKTTMHYYVCCREKTVCPRASPYLMIPAYIWRPTSA